MSEFVISSIWLRQFEVIFDGTAHQCVSLRNKDHVTTRVRTNCFLFFVVIDVNAAAFWLGQRQQ